MGEWIDGWMDGWMDGWTDEWMDGWTDGVNKWLLTAPKTFNSVVFVLVSFYRIYFFH